MKISYAWLSSFFSNLPDATYLSGMLTMAGLEVDSVKSASYQFSGLLVAEIIDVKPHPESDTLKICSIDESSTNHIVICSAPNVRIGLKSVYAKPGSIINGKKIVIEKFKGIESYGMLVGACEIGLTEESRGIIELPESTLTGADFSNIYCLPDFVIDIDLTPNRGDCFSLRGLVREVSTITKKDPTESDITQCEPVSDLELKVKLSEPNKCPIYIGRVVENLSVNKPTPFWITERLRRSGIRSIGPIVDVTNYVMLELGQPMHAFDYEKLVGPIKVRLGDPNESLKLIDGRTIELEKDVLTISDKNGPIALAGIMGGIHTSISSNTNAIFLESAYFDPVCISGRARRYGLMTDASSRFERGVDYEIQERAIERATELIIDICGGVAGPLSKAIASDNVPSSHPINIRKSRLNQQLAMDVKCEEIEEILKNLGLKPTQKNGIWECLNPSWRFDLAIEQDLIEEVARLIGYDNIPVTMPKKELSISTVTDSGINQERLKSFLIDSGLQEVITYSFVSDELQKKFEGYTDQSIGLINPISSDMNEMRCSLFPGLVEVAVHNLNRQQGSVRIFEIGQCFAQLNNMNTQNERLGILISGTLSGNSWSDRRKSDFFDLKGIIEEISKINNGKEIEFAAIDHPSFALGQCAEIKSKGEKRIGIMGSLHPELTRKLDISCEIFLADLSLQPLLAGELSSFKPISKYPDVIRDLSIVVSKTTEWCEIIEAINCLSDPRIIEIQLFDIFQGPGIKPDQKSLTFSIRLREFGKTLEETEINQLVDLIIKRLDETLGAHLRG